MQIETITMVRPIFPQGSPAPVFQSSSNKKLVLNSYTKPHVALGKMKTWPKYYEEWKKWVDRLTPFYESHWKKLGIYQLIQMSKETITF